jgi:RNA polymerase sigma-70 factor, ECF subfamily
MSGIVAQTERAEPLGDTLRSNVLEMTNLVTRRLEYFRRMAMRRLHDAADAEDAVQDALLAAWQHLGQFKGQARMSTWITAIVMNSSRTVIRKRARVYPLPIDGRNESGNHTPIADLLPDCRPDPEAQLRNSEDERRLHQLFARLSPALRLVIHMRSVEGLSIRETAEVLGLSESAVKSRASRAFAKLRRLDRETCAGVYKRPVPRPTKPIDPLR